MKIASITLAGVLHVIERAFMAGFIVVSLQITVFVLWLYARTTFSFDALSARSLSDLHQGMEFMGYSFNTTALILFPLLLCLAFKSEQQASGHEPLKVFTKKILQGTLPMRNKHVNNQDRDDNN